MTVLITMPPMLRADNGSVADEMFLLCLMTHQLTGSQPKHLWGGGLHPHLVQVKQRVPENPWRSFLFYKNLQQNFVEWKSQTFVQLNVFVLFFFPFWHSDCFLPKLLICCARIVCLQLWATSLRKRSCGWERTLQFTVFSTPTTSTPARPCGSLTLNIDLITASTIRSASG